MEGVERKLHAESAGSDDAFALATREFCERWSPRPSHTRAVAFDPLRLAVFNGEKAEPESVGAYPGNLNFCVAAGNPKALRGGCVLVWPKERCGANRTSSFQDVTAMVTIGHQARQKAKQPTGGPHPRKRTEIIQMPGEERQGSGGAAVPHEEKNSIPRGRTKRFVGTRASARRGLGRGRHWE